MPKKAYLAKHFSSSELKEKYLKSKDSVEARRWHLLWKISLGWAIKNSAIAYSSRMFLCLCSKDSESVQSK